MFTAAKLQRFFVIEFLLVAMIVLLRAYPVLSLAVDLHPERCLENIKFAALLHFKPTAFEIRKGDLIYWRPTGALAYVEDEYVVKRVVGVPGDVLEISGDDIRINNQVVASGLPSRPIERVSARSYDKLESIPKDAFFVLGDNPLSYDSRYWGYVPYSSVEGRAIALF